RADRRDHQSRVRPAHVSAVDVRQDGDGDLHPDRRRRDALQLFRLPLTSGGLLRVRVADHHAHFRLSLHLARRSNHGVARRSLPLNVKMKTMTRATVCAGAGALVAILGLSTLDLSARQPSPTAPAKQAVVETTAGTFVLDITPDSAP